MQGVSGLSFSYNAKAELCRLEEGGACCALAECYGMLLYGNTFNTREIKLITGSSAVGQKVIERFRQAFSISFDIVPGAEDTGKQAYCIQSTEKLAKVFEAFGLSPDRLLAHHLNLGVLEDECCRISYIRGAFLTGGAISDPSKSYHLELVTDRFNVSRQTLKLLLDMGFAPKEASRNGNYIIYFKQSTAIEDLLTLIGAPVHAMQLMSAKIEKDVRNTVNRKVNCDTANVTKLVDAAAAQMSAINKIIAAGAFDVLPDKLKETARLRLDYPEMSLKELADAMTPPVTKSCLNHRLRKLMEVSKGVARTEL